MTDTDEALVFACDEAACREDPMFYELFTMEDRWSIIRAVIKVTVSRRALEPKP